MIPTIQGETLVYQQDGQEQVLPVGSAAWFAWLETASTFSFVSETGRFTARREQSGHKRGGWYWKAYRKQLGKLSSRYLGKSETVTLARLQAVAQALADGNAGAASNNDADAAVPSTQVTAQRMDGDSLTPLLSTKLHRPLPRVHLVRRPSLLERLTQGVAGPLTLVSAPAGFGKTTLLAQWIEASSMPVAWLSLDPEDNDPVRFLSYLIASLQTIDDHLGTNALALLHTPQPPPPETVITLLTNELSRLATAVCILVLEDYHVITAEPLHRTLASLVEHLPAQVRLVISTRADPPWPLARLRARGQLTEVRVAHLRFSPEEASAFLRTTMGLTLSPEQISALEQRTEGWIAGLQLAALALQGRADISGFLSGFTGSSRFVLDYLTEEVLSRQPAPVQAFLLHTSLLERLSGSLCDHMRGQEDSQAMLEALERANVFVVPLDEERHWYRYHHLFAEVLRNRLQQAEPHLVPELHRRASAWYEQHHLWAEAIQHALAIPDGERAARLIEPIALPTAFRGQIYTVLGWLNGLPETVIHARPRLCVHYAQLLTLTNHREEAEALLQQAEQRLQEQMPTEQAQIDQGYVLDARSDIPLFSGDIPRAVSLAQQALSLLPETEVIPYAGSLATTIRTYLVSGDVTPTSERAATAAVGFMRAADDLFSRVSSLCVLARLHTLQGRLRQAAATYAQVRQAVPQAEALQTVFSNVFYYVGLGDLLREWNKLDEAEQHLRQGIALIKDAWVVEPFVAALGYTGLARLEQARGNISAALASLDTLTQVAERRRFAASLAPQLAATRAQLELAQGNLAAAIRWADSSGLSADARDVPYVKESEYLALARVRIGQARHGLVPPLLQDVLHLLDCLQESAEASGRGSSVLEILLLRALALEVQGNRTAALSMLEQALVLSEPEGYIRLFADEGTPMLALLRLAHGRSIVPGYVATLLAVCGEQPASELPLSASEAGVLVEPLTEREREVLRLLMEGASNREIAQRLVLSINTVKRHVYNICGKLGVQSRTQVLVKARALKLL
jgi:LuxR family transcriptional regulator, maltose regulon positive regulatory protein